jgi:HTH-type transcriptional regulator / antitoxin MqsA
MTHPSKDGTAMETCPNCQGTRVSIVQRSAEHVEGDEKVSFTDELSKCEDCGEEFYTYEQSMASSRAVASALRAARGLMSPERIRSARLRLEWSQAQFEQAFGLGAKTVARWERGTVAPSRSANFLLWVAERYPEIVKEYASRGRLLENASEFVVGMIQMLGAPRVSVADGRATSTATVQALR